MNPSLSPHSNTAFCIVYRCKKRFRRCFRSCRFKPFRTRIRSCSLQGRTRKTCCGKILNRKYAGTLFVQVQWNRRILCRCFKKSKMFTCQYCFYREIYVKIHDEIAPRIFEIDGNSTEIWRKIDVKITHYFKINANLLKSIVLWEKFCIKIIWNPNKRVLTL